MAGARWTTRQDDVIRQNWRLPVLRLEPLVSRAGPPRAPASVGQRRLILGFVTRPRPRGSVRTLQTISARVAAQHGVSQIELHHGGRTTFLARAQAMAESYATGQFSYGTIGRFYGGRDHTTVIHAIKAYRSLAKQEAA